MSDPHRGDAPTAPRDRQYHALHLYRIDALAADTCRETLKMVCRDLGVNGLDTLPAALHKAQLHADVAAHHERLVARLSTVLHAYLGPKGSEQGNSRTVPKQTTAQLLMSEATMMDAVEGLVEDWRNIREDCDVLQATIHASQQAIALHGLGTSPVQVPCSLSYFYIDSTTNSR